VLWSSVISHHFHWTLINWWQNGRRLILSTVQIGLSVLLFVKPCCWAVIQLWLSSWAWKQVGFLQTTCFKCASMDTHRFCTSFVGVVSPVLQNYRPVSLSFIAKTLKRVAFNKVSTSLSLNNQLDVNQSGFKKGHSTETALLSVTEALRITKAASKSSVLILLDLSAAFDTMNHQILLSSLSSLGITGTSLHWFESYLRDRSFRVIWRAEVTKAHQLTTGDLQGSILLHLHHITETHHICTWFILPLICWWHTALPFISTRWSHSSCTYLKLSGGYLCMDEHLL